MDWPDWGRVTPERVLRANGPVPAMLEPEWTPVVLPQGTQLRLVAQRPPLDQNGASGLAAMQTGWAFLVEKGDLAGRLVSLWPHPQDGLPDALERRFDVMPDTSNMNFRIGPILPASWPPNSS